MTAAGRIIKSPKAIVPSAELAIPLPASHNPYRAREAKAGSPSKTSPLTTSESAITLTRMPDEAIELATTLRCDHGAESLR
jgi:hypothetical protein